jgi:16S rRNA (cytosine1402-N4)-methyltransferase
MQHIPVLADEIEKLLQSCTLRTFFDGTCGGGGHAAQILSSHPELQNYVACDRDLFALNFAKERLQSFSSHMVFHHGNFSEPPATPALFDGVLLDIGVSSFQLDIPERGFSFLREGPLDMRMDQSSSLTASDIINHFDSVELERIFKDFGEERFARRAAHAIVHSRPFYTTVQLSSFLARTLPRSGRIHPATRIFQALRIAVNEELSALSSAIPVLAKRLASSGVFLIITFHSLEDRIVKHAFSHLVSSQEYRFFVKKYIAASDSSNPRARSAKLRAIMRV